MAALRAAEVRRSPPPLECGNLLPLSLSRQNLPPAPMPPTARIPAVVPRPTKKRQSIAALHSAPARRHPTAFIKRAWPVSSPEFGHRGRRGHRDFEFEVVVFPRLCDLCVLGGFCLIRHSNFAWASPWAPRAVWGLTARSLGYSAGTRATRKPTLLSRALGGPQ
jgi:hypothetical protein